MDYGKMRMFYKSLQDAESRFIFMCRWQYLITGDTTYLDEMVKGTAKDFRRKVIMTCGTHKDLYARKDRSDIPVVIYGMGEMAEATQKELRENAVNAVAFCDSFPDGTTSHFLGLPIIDAGSLLDEEYKHCRVVISTWKYQHEVCTALLEAGLREELIFAPNVVEYDYGVQYFGDDFIKPSPEEVFIDGGAYNGATIKDFFRFTNGSYKHIYAFEPHPDSYNVLKGNVERWGCSDVSLINKAVWDCEDVLKFDIGAGPVASQGSHVVENTAGVQTLSVYADSIDATVGDERVTFIKLDVEGSELRALKGAERTILKNKPKLAVCIYHKPVDIMDIPLYLQGLDMGYRFWIRHHNFENNPYGAFTETVLYAV